MIDDYHLFDEVTRHLQQWDRRRLRSDALLWLPRGLLAGLVAAAAVAALARFQPVLHNREVAYIALALALFGVLISIVALLMRKPSTLEQARFFDRLFELQERASTAVEIRTGQLTATPTLAERQLVDTAEAMDRVDAASRLPFKPHWPDVIMIVVAALLIVLAVVVPNDQATILEEQQALGEEIAKQITALQALEQRIQSDPLIQDAEREKLLEPVSSALNELKAEGLSREEVVAVLSEAEADLRELSESGNAEGIRQTLQMAGQPLMDVPSTAPMGQALAGGDLARAGLAANQLAENLAQQSSSESEAITRSLMETAEALAEADPDLAADLAEASAALRDGDLQRAQQALREAAATMQRRAVEQATSTQAQAAADALQSARQEVASAGTPAESSPADEAGQSMQNGDGSGQSAQSAGNGQATGQSATTGAQDGQGAGGPGQGGGHAETIFAPNFVDLSAEDGVRIELPVECIANPEGCGSLLSESPTEFTVEQSLVPYEQVFGDYRDAAFEALEGDYVPLGMKSLVRDYFSSLEP